MTTLEAQPQEPTTEPDTVPDVPPGPDVPQEPTQEPDEPQEPTTEPEPAPEGRCEAETTAGGSLYRCALDSGHDDEHAFQAVAGEDEAEGTTAGWAPRDEREVAKAARALEREAERHAAAVQKILGADSEALVQCVLCAPNLAGWRYDGAPTPEVATAVRAAIGLPDVSNFKPSHTETQCNNCGGLGKVKTGSLVPAHETASCDACKGRGYIETRQRTSTTDTTASSATATNGEAPQIDDGVQRDMFGTPITDDDYGKMPGMRKRPIEYWQQQRGA